MSQKQLEADIADLRSQLVIVDDGLQADPENAEFKQLKNDVNELLEPLLEELAALKQKSAAAAPEPEPEPQPTWTREKAQAIPDTKPLPSSFKVNDEVMAKWLSGDKAYYPAKITSVTGSSANPIFTVSFKGYGNSERLSINELRTLAPPESKKRKVDDRSSAATQGSATGAAPGVIKASPNVNEDGLRRQDSAKAADTTDKPAKKLKSKNQLEKGRNKWQEFSKGKMGNMYKKDSMFRTGEGVHAKVGVTGSGQAMRKDPTRSKNRFDKSHQDDE